MWSPETLIFILHLSVIVCTGILISRFVNSLPKLRMTIRQNAALLAGAAAVSAVSMAAYGLTAPGYIDPDSAAIDQTDRIVVAEVAPFGMASRKPVPVPDPVDVAPAAVDTAQDVATSPLFNVHCSACHGPSGEGVEGLGVTLVASEFVTGSDVDELVVFLQEGRMPDADTSLTGRPMPAFAWMGDDELHDLVVFMQDRAAIAGN